jgi:hypothetical protein
MNLESTDKRLIGGATIGAIVIFILLAIDFDLLLVKGYADSSQTPIGKMVDGENIVAIRSETLPLWAPVKGNETVFNGDQVYTGPNSNALVKFEQGVSLNIGSSSLVVLEILDEYQLLTLLGGQASGKFAAGSKGIALKIGNDIVKLRGDGEVRMETGENGGVSFTPVSGQFNLDANGRQLNINSGLHVSLNSLGKISELIPSFIEPVEPARGRVIHSKPGAMTTFRWLTELPGPFEVDVDQDPSFEKATSVTTRNFSAQLPLTSGSYLWRVKTKSPNGKGWIISQTMQFQLESSRPPKLVWPPNNYNVGEDEQPSLVWEPVPGAASYEVQSSDSPDYSNSSTTLVQGKAGLAIPSGKERRYWRVLTVDADGRRSSWSPARSYTHSQEVQQDIKIDTQPLSPPANAIVNIAVAPIIKFQWTIGNEKITHGLQVSLDQEFKGIVFEKKSATGTVNWGGATVGAYYWRVKIGANQFSQSRKLNVIKSTPLIAPWLPPRIEIELPKPKKSFSLLEKVLDILTGSWETAEAQSKQTWIKWEPVTGANSYDIAVAQDPAMKSVILRKEVETPGFYWPEDLPGRYYLEVKSVDKKGRRSKPSRNVEVLASYGAPILYGPAPASTIPFPSAEKPQEFTWEHIPGSQNQLQVSRNPGFTDLVTNQTYYGGSAALQALPAELLYWRVAARYQPNLPLKFSEARTLTVTPPPEPLAVIEPPEEEEEVEEDPPEFIRPNKLEMKVGSSGKRQVTFKWDIPGDEDSPSRIQVADNKQFINPIVDEVVTERQLSKVLKSGFYLYRSRAETDSGPAGPWSEVGRLSVKKGKPIRPLFASVAPTFSTGIQKKKRAQENGYSSTLRIGLPIINQDVFLLTSTRTAKADMKVRKGFLKGLFGFADHLTSAEEEFEGDKIKLGWTKGALGYAYSFKPPLISQIDVGGMLGLWQRSVVLPTIFPDGSFGAVDYSSRGQPFIGYHLGLELGLFLELGIRLNHERQVTTNLLGGSMANETGVSATSYGAEFYTPAVLVTGDKRIFLLGFVTRQDILFSKSTSEQETILQTDGLSDSSEFSEIFYSMDSFGAGVGVLF